MYIGLLPRPGYHEKAITYYTLTISITKPVDKKVKNIIFTELAPRPIKYINRNVHYKNEALKPLYSASIGRILILFYL